MNSPARSNRDRGRRQSPRFPSHTTGHACPHPAVRELRLRAQTGQSHLVEQLVRKGDVQSHRPGLPPSARVFGDAGGQERGQATCDQFPIEAVRPRFHCFGWMTRRRWRIHLSRSWKIRGVSASRKYPFHPRRYVRRSSTIFPRFCPHVRRVSRRTRSFIVTRAFLAMRMRISFPGATQKENPRNFRFRTRATALFVSLTWSRSLPYRRRSCAITRSPARWDRT